MRGRGSGSSGCLGWIYECYSRVTACDVCHASVIDRVLGANFILTLVNESATARGLLHRVLTMVAHRTVYVRLEVVISRVGLMGVGWGRAGGSSRGPQN